MSPPTLLTLPRELRDEIIGHLLLPELVYTSSHKPNTPDWHRGTFNARTYVDSRVYLPCRIWSSALAVCRQLRDECLEHHAHILNTQFISAPAQNELERSAILDERMGLEVDGDAERLDDYCLRITLEAYRSTQGTFGYAVPTRNELSPCFLTLLPLMQNAKKLRLVIWPGVDWWNGARPRAMHVVDGRAKFDPDAVSDKSDAVSFAIEKILEQLPNVQELDVHLLAHVGDLSRWDLPDEAWQNVQYWLNGPVAKEGWGNLKRVRRRLAGVWISKLCEAFYVQEETRAGDTWHVKRHGDMQTDTLMNLADLGELDDDHVVVDEEFERMY